jgi:hypothetical protein
MTKKIIWHIGFRKTGTTSQQYLLRHLSVENNPNLLVSSRGNLTYNWRKLVVSATRAKKRPNVEKLRKEMAVVATMLRDVTAKTILISDENLFAFSLYEKDGGHFFDWGVDILPLIETEFADFENVFVAYTRPMESWLKSSYSQDVKRGRTWLSYDNWRKQVPKGCNWADGLAAIRSAISAPLILLTQETELEGGRPLGAQLLQLAGVSPDEIAAIGPAPHLNQSFSPESMRLLRMLNFFGLNGLLRPTLQRQAKARELSQIHKVEGAAAGTKSITTTSCRTQE